MKCNSIVHRMRKDQLIKGCNDELKHDTHGFVCNVELFNHEMCSLPAVLMCNGCYMGVCEFHYNEFVRENVERKANLMTKKSDSNNEILHQAWLKAACELFRQNFFDFPEVVATYGFPAPNSSDGFRGACHFPNERGKERRPVIIIHPAEWATPIEVLTVLLHECIHAKFDKSENHGSRFIEVAQSVGLQQNGDGEWSRRSKELTDKLEEALKLLPPMPTDPLGRGEVKRQKGRMLLFMCSCKFKIRCGKKELLANCDRCNTKFELQEDKGE